MRLFNTLTGTREEFAPLGPQVRMYVCGITPYDAAHVGHAMKDVVFDVLRRYLEWRGFDVLHVQNHTDVDDKIIARAAQTGDSPFDLAERNIESYLADLRDLNVLPAHLYPRVTTEMPSIIEMIEGLIDRGFAYERAGSVYYRVLRKPDYGKLSHRTVDSMLAGARLEVDEDKEHPADFALWKAAKEGEPSWDSPWGKGRPGWHIECSAMSLKYVGNPLDIHGGGLDLIFPHHENEIAQSEAFTGEQPFARWWVHNGLMQMNGEKMSKSLGNVVTVRDAIERYGADAIRLFMLTSHYRSPINWTDAGIEAAVQNAERIRAAATEPGPSGGPPLDAGPFRERFTEVMEDDLNTPLAIVVLYDLVREINRGRTEGADVTTAQATLRELAGVLGLSLEARRQAGGEDIAPFVELLIELRRELRKEKQYALADQVRSRLTNLGITLEDTAQGTRWKRA
jgi:cysteinyl-tRNA synthetase